jgi:hypothetical protein
MDETNSKNIVDVPFELDLPPEFCEYHDTGCELASACLSCPLPDCIHDTYRKPKSIRPVRSTAIAGEYARGNHNMAELAEVFQVSVRTVKRAIHVSRKGRHFKKLSKNPVTKFPRRLPRASTESDAKEDYEEENIDC